MNPDQALQVFETLRQNLQGTGKDHDTIREAIAVLTEALKEKKKDEKCPEPS